MVCAGCQAAVPDESTFCLACGARLVQSERLESTNGGGSPLAPAPAPPGAKRAYALAFRPIPDERLRYRVARWVAERAPAHPLAEIQEGLTRGSFLTFLALTPEEADLARQGIERLGIAPALVSLAPATGAEVLAPEGGGARRAKGGAAGMSNNWIVALAVGGGLLVVGLVLMRFLGGRGF